METIRVLRHLKRTGKINTQQFKTYQGQINSDNELGCIKGLLRKGLITKEESERLILSYQLEWTE